MDKIKEVANAIIGGIVLSGVFVFCYNHAKWLTSIDTINPEMMVLKIFALAIAFLMFCLAIEQIITSCKNLFKK